MMLPLSVCVRPVRVLSGRMCPSPPLTPPVPVRVRRTPKRSERCQINFFFYGILFAPFRRIILPGLSVHDLWSGCLPRTRLSVINGIMAQRRHNGSSSDVASFFFNFSFFVSPSVRIRRLSRCLPPPPSSVFVSPSRFPVSTGCKY